MTNAEVEKILVELEWCVVEIERLRAALAAAEGAAWQPIETALRDRMILVYAPAYEGLPEIVGQCRWHEDAGFCVDELRFPTHWRLMPAPPKEVDHG